MKIPDSVNILGLVYTVDLVDNVEFGSTMIGQCDHYAQSITLDRSVSVEQREQIFLHEVIHAVLCQLKQEDAHDDEVLVQSLAVGLHQALFAGK